MTQITLMVELQRYTVLLSDCHLSLERSVPLVSIFFFVFPLFLVLLVSGQAILVASVVLPCVCDTVSFNPSNPSMLAVTATSAHHDGVGGGHPGGKYTAISS